MYLAMNASVRASPSAGVFASGDGKLDDRLSKHPSQSGRLRDRSDLFLEVVHVRVGRCARLDHLERGKTGARSNERRS